MTYRYCDKCGFENGMHSPTPEEIVRNAHVCKNCGHVHAVDEDARTELMVELFERVAALEARAPNHG